jgi:small subunit ribosomal protein S16
MGGNKKPFFRIIAIDARGKQEGSYLEALGWYDPKVEGANYELKVERIEYWKSKGAILSDTVRNLMRRKKRASAA